MSPSLQSGSWASASGIAIPTRIPGSGSMRSKFGDVWDDMASEYVPTTMTEAFRMCEFLYENFSAYKKGSERVADYFMTGIVGSGGDDEKRREHIELLDKDARTKEKIREVNLNFMGYGNAVVSPHFPFVRALSCTTCRTETSFDGVLGAIGMENRGGQVVFQAGCRKCRTLKPHLAIDRPALQADKIGMVTWDPKRVHIDFNEITGDREYWVSIAEYVKRKVTEQSRFFLQTLPMPFLECVLADKKLKIDPKYVFHMREPTLAGLPTRGWGTPPILGAFRNFFRLQVLMRQDERLMMDYITPMRVVSPRNGSYTDGNSIHNASMAKFAANFQDAVAIHRLSGVDWHVFPFPIEYNAVGGEGRQHSTRDLVEDEENRLLNARGVPPEFYRASMTIQAAPVAMRLFERSWSSLVDGNNRLLQWWSDIVSGYLRTGSYSVEFESISVVDDLENKMWRLQAMQGGLVSRETGMSPMRIDPSEESDKIIEEQMEEQRKQMEAQERMEMESMSLGADNQVGGGQQGGAPDAVESVSNADQIASELLDPNLPQSEVNRRLRAIKQTNDALHAMVRQKMTEKRSVARSVGQDVGMQAVLSGDVQT